MRERLKTLQHLLEVYRRIEDVRRAEAERAAGEVRLVEVAIDRQQSGEREAFEEERLGLSKGDAESRLYAMAARTIAAAGKVKLERLRVEREERSRESRGRYLSSRSWSERMKSLTEGLEAEMRSAEDRRTQIAADELYLARRMRRGGFVRGVSK
jgi:hypothetical protein